MRGSPGSHTSLSFVHAAARTRRLAQAAVKRLRDSASRQRLLSFPGVKRLSLRLARNRYCKLSVKLQWVYLVDPILSIGLCGNELCNRIAFDVNKQTASLPDTRGRAAAALIAATGSVPSEARLQCCDRRTCTWLPVGTAMTCHESVCAAHRAPRVYGAFIFSPPWRVFYDRGSERPLVKIRFGSPASTTALGPPAVRPRPKAQASRSSRALAFIARIGSSSLLSMHCS